jgi:hypothetical protein
MPNGDVLNLITNDVASMMLFTPTKTLLQLCVRDPKYILRKSLVFTNLDSLIRNCAGNSAPPGES